MLFIIHREQKLLVEHNFITKRRRKRKRCEISRKERLMNKKIKKLRRKLRFLEVQMKIMYDLVDDNLNNNV